MSLLGPNGQPVSPSPVPGPSPEAVPPSTQEVITAFVVFQAPNGQWMATDDLAMAITAARAPVPDDMIAGCENVKQAVIAQRTAQITAGATIQAQIAMAQQARQAMPTAQEQAVAARLMNGGR